MKDLIPDQINVVGQNKAVVLLKLDGDAAFGGLGNVAGRSVSNRDGEPVAGGDLSGLFAGAEYADNESESRNAGWGEGVGGVAGAGGGEENGYGGGRPSELIVVVGRKAGIHQVEFAFEFAEDFVVDLVFGAQMSGDGTFDVAELLGEVAVEIRLVDALTAVRCEVQFAGTKTRCISG